MKRLTIAQIKSMHSALILATGGVDGIRDEGLLWIQQLVIRFKHLMAITSTQHYRRKPHNLDFRS